MWWAATAENHCGGHFWGKIKSLIISPAGRDTKIVNLCPSSPKNKTQVPKAEVDVQSKRQSQNPIIAIYFSDSIFLLSGAHLDKRLRDKSKCNYILPQERALNTFLLYCQRLGQECKSEKVLLEASFINRNGNRHLYATNKSIKGGKELEMAFIALINFGDYSSWWWLDPASSCHPPGANGWK